MTAGFPLKIQMLQNIKVSIMLNRKEGAVATHVVHNIRIRNAPFEEIAPACDELGFLEEPEEYQDDEQHQHLGRNKVSSYTLFGEKILSDGGWRTS